MNPPIGAQLAYVDEHRQPVGAPADAVWGALARVLRRDMIGSKTFARLLGCDPAESTAQFTGRPGETVPGFRVVGAEPGHRLELRGRHRFSNYALTFVLEGGELKAQTHAEFPGFQGRLYRALVIESGMHRLVTRRLLRRIVRAA